MSAQPTSEDAQDEQDNPVTEDADPEGEGEGEEEDDGAGFFVVEKILEEQEVDGVLLYKVRWENYGPADDTFEPATELAHCTDILEAWEEEKKNKAAAKAAKKKKKGM